MRKGVKKNGRVAEKIKEYKFFDCHANNAEIMTTWNTTRVDFILCNKENVGGIRAEYFYTLNSDHIPVVITLEPGLTFRPTWRVARTRSRMYSGGKYRRKIGKSKRRKSKHIQQILNLL